jgi:hypothetical protein
VWSRQRDVREQQEQYEDRRRDQERHKSPLHRALHGLRVLTPLGQQPARDGRTRDDRERHLEQRLPDPNFGGDRDADERNERQNCCVTSESTNENAANTHGVPVRFAG